MFDNPWVNLIMFVTGIMLAGGLGASLALLRASRQFDYTIKLEKEKRQQIMLTVGTYVASTLGPNIPKDQVDRHVQDAVSRISDIDADEPQTESLSLPTHRRDGYRTAPIT